MTVLYLSDVYFPRVNGVSTSIATFRRELELRGVAVPLLCPGYSGRGEAGIARPAEARLVRLDGFRVPFDPEDRWVPARRFRAAESRLPAFDLVHVQTPFAAHRAGVDLARRRGVPVVETYHTYFEHYFEHYLPFLPAGLCRRLARRLICISHARQGINPQHGRQGHYHLPAPAHSFSSAWSFSRRLANASASR